MLKAINIKKHIQTKGNKINILEGISFEVKEREMVAIMGPSGCGKSTLLGIIAGLDHPSSGKVLLHSEDLYNLSENQLNTFRSQNIGIIFQNHNLINELNCIDNIRVPLVFSKSSNTISEQKLSQLINFVGLSNKQKIYPYEMSGGEQQRTAIARALVNQPKIILGDEPTGSLDENNSRKVMDIFKESIKEFNCSILLVTHDKEVAKQCDRVIYMCDGKLVSNYD